MTNPRILVTGGSGYLGEWVVRLACPNWDVTATYLHHPVDRKEGEPGAAWHRLDVRAHGGAEPGPGHRL
jgi:nucleoside-diphosphate-sugar epimerase